MKFGLPLAGMTDLALLHNQYQQQAEWTRAIRQYLCVRLSLPTRSKILEVGCGTGVILQEIQSLFNSSIYVGIDKDCAALVLAQSHDKITGYAQSEAVLLPFPDQAFDLVFCHYFLLWAKPLPNILHEIFRVLLPGAPFIAFAEPDYGGAIDYPSQLSLLSQYQEDSLKNRGADTRIGRSLAGHFLSAGLTRIEAGILGAQWQIQPQPPSAQPTEILKDDLAYLPGLSDLELKNLLEMDESSTQQGTRIRFVPTFYGIGFKPA